MTLNSGGGEESVEVFTTESLVDGVAGSGNSIDSLIWGGESGDLVLLFHYESDASFSGSNRLFNPFRFDPSLFLQATPLNLSGTYYWGMTAEIGNDTASETTALELRNREDGFTTMVKVNVTGNTTEVVSGGPSEYTPPDPPFEMDLNLVSTGGTPSMGEGTTIYIWGEIA